MVIRVSVTYAKLGHFDDARRCMAEAMTVVEATKERCWEAEVHRVAGTWRKRRCISSALSPLRVSNKQSPGNCARQ